MKKIILTSVILMFTLFSYAQLIHPSGYFKMYPYGTTYDDGSHAKLFYDGNSKLINFWNSDNNKVYTNLKTGSIDVIGEVSFRGVDKNLPTKFWKLYNNANTGGDYGLLFKYDNKLAMYLDTDRSLNLRSVLKFRGTDANNPPQYQWKLYHNANVSNDYGLQFNYGDELAMFLDTDRSLNLRSYLKFKGTNVNSIPEKEWKIFHSANASNDYGLHFNYDNKLAMYLDKDRSLNLRSVLKFRGTDADSAPTNQWRIYHNANASNDYGLVFKLNDDVKIQLVDDIFRFNGNVKAKEIKVQTNVWADYVFRPEYNLPTLEEVEKHIHEKGHLKDIPSELEVVSEGISIGEMNVKLLQKIEELTLYTIEQQKAIKALQVEVTNLKAKNNKL